jgi:acetyl esterase/lipase
MNGTKRPGTLILIETMLVSFRNNGKSGRSMKYRLMLFLTVTLALSGIGSAQSLIDLYRKSDRSPNHLRDSVANGRIWKVATAQLLYFKPLQEASGRASVLIFPGGGYTHLAIEKEGAEVARAFNKMGMPAFVLKYRLNPSDALLDAERALDTLGKNQKEYGIDSKKICLVGFSAGGHLAISLVSRLIRQRQNDPTAVFPAAEILVYPMINAVNFDSILTPSFPKTFIVHAADDKLIPVNHVLQMFISFESLKVPVELHVFQVGGHGFGLGSGEDASWIKLCKEWLISEKLITQN